MSEKKESQFVQLLEDNKYRILRICQVYAQCAEDQQDLYQEIVLELWKSFDTIHDLAYTNTWFFRVALNVSMQFRRKSRLRKKRSIDSIQFIAQSATAQESIEKQELKNQLYACIALLEESNRAIVLLHLEGVANQQIAEIMGLSDNHTAIKLKRIREKLKVCLKQQEVC
ncbi:RNA polymerase sigma factor [Tunicatimonas pelagia]|uniref:RNA polymerase sigma factor n=1 Tax=Tunicatimonas pelagia TaxID=931531 RepID=UPI002666107E|nr:sigma-70 family RNA polymerase sigma factor [Tunicatimonas pelagia]WKN44723.1 sigma-70 family RNA polymerase sigma factor [Tunicatimonas pelagia]